ncbi:MAG: hypothetical protein AAF720_06455 [Pseudomonadota bacterium]
MHNGWGCVDGSNAHLRNWLVKSAFSIFFVFLLFRIGQHVFDLRDWHKPWSYAHLDRFIHSFCHLGAKGFPCLIVGGGGSGKSTLAAILEKEFLRRQIFRPSGFIDEGGEQRLVTRVAGGDSIANEIRDYKVTWRPERYKVGRLADAYDLPGQIKQDWAAAIEKVSNRRRVAIINVVTGGATMHQLQNSK